MRFYTYTIMIVGIVLLLNVTGIQTPVIGSLLGWLGLTSGASIAIQNMESSTGFGLFEILLVTSVGAGVVLGAFGRAPDTRYLTAGLIFAITSALITDMISIFLLVNKSSEFGGVFSTAFSIIMGVLVVGLFVTAIQFWQSPD